MKNIMRRTVAFMLMACLLLSVMPSVVKADASTGVYSYIFGTEDGSSVAGADLVSDETKFARGDSDTAYFFKMIGRKDKTTVSTALNTWLKVETYLFAVRLTGIEDVDAEYSLDVLTYSSHNCGFDVYVLPGDTVSDDLTVAYLQENYDARCTVGTSPNTHYPSDTTFPITADDVRDSDGSVILVMAYNGGTTNNVRVAGATLTKIVPPDVASVKTTYDFTNLGALLGTAAGDHAYFIPTDADGNEVLDEYQQLYDAGKINYMPYAERSGESGGDVYAENGKYKYGLFGQFTGKGGLFAVKIANPGVGTYNFAAALTSGYANATAQGQVYVIPVSDVEAAMASSQVTASEALYNLIQSDYAGKHIAEGSFKTNESVSGTVEIKSAGDHIVVFYAASIRSGNGTQAWMHVKNFTLTNSTAFNSLDAALAAANSKFDTVTLLDNASVESVLNIGTGATLDLNGNTLNGTVNVTDGNLVDSSNGTGAVANITGLEATNAAVSVKDGDIYRLYNYTAKDNGYKVNAETGALEFWFDADFDAAVYSKLTAANGITINAVLKVNGVEKGVLELSEKVASWIAQDGTEDNALGVSVTGYENLSAGDTITVTPVFETNTGVSGVFGGEIVYTVPAAE